MTHWFDLVSCVLLVGYITTISVCAQMGIEPTSNLGILGWCHNQLSNQARALNIFSSIGFSYWLILVTKKNSPVWLPGFQSWLFPSVWPSVPQFPPPWEWTMVPTLLDYCQESMDVWSCFKICSQVLWNSSFLQVEPDSSLLGYRLQ